MEYKPTNCIVVPSKKDFYKKWLEFLAPVHKLRNREMDFAAAILERRAEIQKTVNDNSLVDGILFSLEEKKKMMKKFNMKVAYYYLVINKLKKAKFIINAKVNPKMIPRFGESKKICQLLIVLDTNE